jgi:outer membrane lipoprotein SlyB
MKNTVMAALLCLLSACSNLSNEPAHIAYGKVLSVQTRQVVEQQPNLTGALVGGVAGGVVGHQFGKGNGKTAMTVLGAVAGAAAGSQYNQQETIKQVSDLAVQIQDGKVFTITTPAVGFQVGQAVRIVQQGRNATIEAINN